MRRFAFVTNIIEIKDVRLKGIYPILGRLVPLYMWKLILRRTLGNKKWNFLRKRGYLKVAEYDVFGKIKGYTILVMLTAEQVVNSPLYARHRIMDACLYAQDELGVDVIGLGSLTKSITNEGSWLKKQGINIAVTHGDTYTVATVIDGIEKIAKSEGLNFFSLGIAGAYGKIGEAVARAFCKKGINLILMGRKNNHLKKLISEEPFKNSKSAVKTTMDLRQMLNSVDIALMATSAPYSIVSAEHLQKEKNYLIYDAGQPYNLDPLRYAQIIKKGFKLKRYDGAIVQPPISIDIGFNMRLRRNREYACFAETLLQALSDDNNSHVGKVDLRHVEETKKWAEEYGFCHAPLECFQQPLMEFVISSVVDKTSLSGVEKNELVTKFASFL